MKLSVRLGMLAAVVLVVGALVYFLQRASAPESAIIAGEKGTLEKSVDKSRMEKDALYAVGIRSKLQFLDYRMATAYNKEQKPEAARPILDKLIAEEARSSPDISRGSRSLLKEAGYLDELREACRLLRDEACEKQAMDRRDALLSRAEAAKKRERRDEGKSVGIGAE